MKSAAVSIQRHSFNGGELSPDLHFREDLEQYHNRCKSLENTLVSLTGAAFRRPGTQFRAVIPGSDGDSFRLVPFTFDRDTTFTILFACSESFDARIYDSDGALVASLDVPYLPEELAALRFCQSYDVLFLCHPNHPLQRIERRPTGWAIEPHEFRGGPYRDLESDPEGMTTYWVEEWHPLAEYSVGDYVSAGSTSSGNSAVDAAENVALSLVSDFQREDVWVDAAETIKRTYPTIKVKTDENNLGTLAGNGMVVRLVGCSDPTLDGYYVVAGTQGHNRTLFLHQDDYYIEVDTTAGSGSTGGGGVVDTTGDFPIDAYLEEDSIAVLSRLERSTRIWRCKLAGGTGTSPLDMSGGTYWEEVFDWRGPVYAVAWDPNRFAYNGTPFEPSEQTTHVFTSDMEGVGYRARSAEKAEITGRFKRNSSTEIVYRDGTINSEKTTYNPSLAGSEVVSRSFPIFGTVTLRTDGTWRGILSLQISEDQGETWNDLAAISSQNNRNGTATRTVDRTGTLGRLRYEETEAILLTGDYENENECQFYVEISGERYEEYVFEEEICEPGLLGRLSPLYPLRELGKTPFWSWNAFNDVFGYAGSVTLHEERLVLAGTRAQPGTVWGSAINDFEEWGAGSLDTSPVAFTLASDTFSPIEWILSRQDLLIGTSTGVWSLGSRSSESALSPTNVSAKRHTEIGCAPMAALLSAETAMFVERGGLRLRGMVFDEAFASYASEDLSALSDHIRNFVEMHRATVPFAMLWMLREDGTVASFTADRQHAVAGWARHTVGSEVKTLCTTPTDTGADLLWMVVRRGSSFYLESLSLDSTVYLDCHVSATHGTRVASLSIPTGLDGYIVSAQGVALVDPDHYSVAGNVATIDAEYTFSRVDAGVPFTSTVRPTSLAPHGGKYRVSGLDLYLSDSYGLEVSLDGAVTWQPVAMAKTSAFGYVGEGLAVPPVPVSGRHYCEARSGYTEEVDVSLRSSYNGGFRLLALAARATATEVR